MVLEAIRFDPPTRDSPPTLRILDQLLLPHTISWLTIADSGAAFEAIKSMRVRGAPAIALVAALSLVVEDVLSSSGGKSLDALAMAELYRLRLEYLVTSRPTAVNLADATEKLKRVVGKAALAQAASADDVKDAYASAAEEMLQNDVRDNEAIGTAGAQWIRENTEAGGFGRGIVTICNTGSLATAGYGTALGIVRSLHASSDLRQVFYLETRPYNQGSRLTGFELIHDAIPATLITDSMAAALFKVKGDEENIVAAIVGADRVAANGDTANKIGTYGLAVLARQHGVRFLVAAPRTTIDLNTKSGDDIVIEERPHQEVLAVKGPRVTDFLNGQQIIEEGTEEVVSIAAIGTKAWNPAFDVTPAELVDAIITEVGVVEKQNGKFKLYNLFDER